MGYLYDVKEEEEEEEEGGGLRRLWRLERRYALNLISALCRSGGRRTFQEQVDDVVDVPINKRRRQMQKAKISGADDASRRLQQQKPTQKCRVFSLSLPTGDVIHSLTF